jgi:hypothetical protein
MDDQFDDIDPAAPGPAPLSEEEEGLLERKVVWLFGAPRSGTTWLGTQLLSHQENINWNEPYIGNHLGPPEPVALGGGEDWYRDDYFFSPRHKSTWSPALRKLILCRTYSQAWGLGKNIIIKEPNGIAGAQVLLDCLPNSKVIFLLRDVIESLVDAHGPHSWNKGLSSRPLSTRARRLEAIQFYAESWKTFMTAMWAAFRRHDPGLRFLVRYQELRRNTLKELKAVYDFLNVRVGRGALRTIVDRYSFDNIPDSEKGPGKFTRAATTGAGGPVSARKNKSG